MNTEKSGTTKARLEEIRKIYPKANMRWTEEEDTKLRALYTGLTEPVEDFEDFLQEVSGQFGRRTNGIRVWPPTRMT